MLLMMILMLTVTDMETAIMHRLQNSILQQSSLLIDVVHYAAELDWSVGPPHLTLLSLTSSHCLECQSINQSINQFVSGISP